MHIKELGGEEERGMAGRCEIRENRLMGMRMRLLSFLV